MPEVGRKKLDPATYFFPLWLISVKFWNGKMPHPWVFVLIVIGTGIALVNSLDGEAEQDVQDEPEPFFPQESEGVSTSKCPKDVLIGGISDISDEGSVGHGSGGALPILDFETHQPLVDPSTGKTLQIRKDGNFQLGDGHVTKRRRVILVDQNEGNAIYEVDAVTGRTVQIDENKDSVPDPLALTALPYLRDPKTNAENLIDPDSQKPYLIDFQNPGYLLLDSSRRLYSFTDQGLPNPIHPAEGTPDLTTHGAPPLKPSKNDKGQFLLLSPSGHNLTNKATGKPFIVHPLSGPILIDEVSGALFLVEFTGKTRRKDPINGFPYLISPVTDEPFKDGNGNPIRVDPSASAIYFTHPKSGKVYFIDPKGLVYVVDSDTGKPRPPALSEPISSLNGKYTIIDPESSSAHPLTDKKTLKPFSIDITGLRPTLLDSEGKAIMDHSAHLPHLVIGETGDIYVFSTFTGQPFEIDRNGSLKPFLFSSPSGKPTRTEAMTDENGNGLRLPTATGYKPVLLEPKTKEPLLAEDGSPYFADMSSSRVYVRSVGCQQLLGVDPEDGKLQPVDPASGTLEFRSSTVDIEGCSSSADFVSVGSGLYAPKLVTDFRTARRCCLAHGLDLVDLSKVQKSFAEFTEFSRLDQGIWVKGPSGNGKSMCGFVGFVPAAETELGQLCNRTFGVICDGGDESDIGHMHGKCESRERFERVSKGVVALKMASLTYDQAQRCCHAAHLHMIDLQAEDVSNEKEEINSFLQTKNVSVWHKKQDEHNCKILCGGPSVGDRSCHKTSSVMCSGIWRPSVHLREDHHQCDSMHFTSILHGNALVSSTPAQRETAEMCCKLQPGYESLLSLDHEDLAFKFANNHRVHLREPYHVYTEGDKMGNYFYVQGKMIPKEDMSKDKYARKLSPGDCLFAVVEPEVGERVTRYVTGKCNAYQPFVCMRFDPEQIFNMTCKPSDYFDRLESRRQSPSEAQRFELSNQNRYLSKVSLEVDIGGWKSPTRNPVRAYELVQKTFEVFRKIVPVNVLPLGFTTKLMILFVEMNGRYGPLDKVDMISEGDLTRIEGILQKCKENLPVMPYVFNDCKTLILGTTDDKNDTSRPNYYCPSTEFSYNHFTTDPLLHATQNVFQTVRNLCFPIFRENSIRMFHRWQLAINDVFAPKLGDRWSLQPETTDYWDKLLGAHFEEKVRVTDSVTQAVIDKSSSWAMTYPRGAPPPVRMPGF